ncbi:IS66 family transposase [Parashewanella hymeniacidonis]|uniref:IS66 family transposase n=1 Tax=Parashewanella hymeniacidonis TaxID=2807618 RepID=UPI003083FA2C
MSRATLINWMKKGIELLKPIYQAMLKHILKSKVLAMDEVPIKAGKAGKGKMKQTYFWPIYGEEDEVAFTWSATKSAQHAIEQLTGFNGTLLTDGYSAYTKTVDTLNQQEHSIIHATCWVHCRRYFEKALALEPESAQQALDEMALLYKNEKHIREKEIPAERALAYRQDKSEPVVYRFFKWLHEQRQRPELLPSNPLRVALEYAAERETQLKVFLTNPNVPMDTNHLERALRVIPMWRKNYLFCWTELGAEHLGILQSLMVTCRLQGFNPYHYLVDVLQRISQHPNALVEELIPSKWRAKFKDVFLKSDLESLSRSSSD